MIEQKDTPLVSFIITYHEQPIQMLCECIDSILALSLRSVERELIVVDDGSEVSPMNGLMQYADDVVYVRQRNQGVSIARNTALRLAQGTYIQFVDADDTLLQAPYEHCIDIIRYGEETDMVLFDFTHTKNNSQASLDTPQATSGSEYMRNHNMHGASWCYLFRRAMRGQLEFTPGVDYGEDEEFTAQLMLRAEHVYVTSAKAYFYRQHEASAIQQSNQQKRERRLNDNWDVILHLHTLCDKLPQDDRLALQRRVAQLSMDYIYNTIVLSHSSQALDKCLQQMRSAGLFPLPDRDYSRKYVWFRKMTNTSFGRSILLHTLPYLKRER